MVVAIDSQIYSDYIEIGYCAKSHGIKGGLTFSFFNEDSALLRENVSIFLVPQNKKSNLPIDGANYQIEKISYGNKVIVYLQGVVDKTAADAMIPFLIKIKRELLPKLNDGEYYVAEMVGLSAYDFNSKKYVGKIVDYYENGAHLVFVIRGEGVSGDLEIPFTDAFFPHVDLDKKEVMVIVPEFVE
ncbi:MAG: 16S rRNA processing protein RimM [Bdellovibrionales bacterium RIFOXYD12_FULL_39_22]|nr:MAG: 16S rRNA processing protein RimM [Bdellovibrionales bacterium RIFOXYB1_FULL_39_21]OFZ45001.1 MAG: 16S rRNA processing protein RimM [Bdellovibrionales bacterium RIFOXYC12_FULL_39_17]OFZ49439.1 MAG: 16S rRNA processing protein RimM [Bdellovibrionales bacterium RIFOXYC1_FULL_39_130]OFZ73281.1 MAG: 16S rRNA processing protein RimM [Bdellovibrionales bacterium RIFOXYC2_FULL_39_8]OFZ77178.1 MAG: 16S rRNA processing protein RimM [Bdellovibrionales bacterium RIFOXYD1_FULL_39_84]OFZ95623.1 MAG: